LLAFRLIGKQNDFSSDFSQTKEPQKSASWSASPPPPHALIPFKAPDAAALAISAFLAVSKLESMLRTKVGALLVVV